MFGITDDSKLSRVCIYSHFSFFFSVGQVYFLIAGQCDHVNPNKSCRGRRAATKQPKEVHRGATQAAEPCTFDSAPALLRFQSHHKQTLPFLVCRWWWRKWSWVLEVRATASSDKLSMTVAKEFKAKFSKTWTIAT